MPAAKPHDPTEITTANLARYYSEEEEAWLLMERIRWPQGPVCPRCQTVGNAYYLQPKTGARKTKAGNVTYRRLWKCADCKEQFSVLVGTIFEDSKVPLYKWLLAVHLLCAGKNGISAHELHRTLKVTYKTAWFMAHRVRYAMQQSPLREKLSGIVEADETYFGGALRGVGMGNWRPNKTPVFALVERGSEVRSQVMPSVTGKNIAAVLREETEPERTILFTDTASPYRKVGTEAGWHETVNHGIGEYGRGVVSTNTIEGYFSQLKRSIDGTYHHVSAKHLPRYLAEFDFRYNLRKAKDGERTETAIIRAAGKRLTYKQPSEE